MHVKLLRRRVHGAWSQVCLQDCAGTSLTQRDAERMTRTGGWERSQRRVHLNEVKRPGRSSSTTLVLPSSWANHDAGDDTVMTGTSQSPILATALLAGIQAQSPRKSIPYRTNVGLATGGLRLLKRRSTGILTSTTALLLIKKESQDCSEFRDIFHIRLA